MGISGDFGVDIQTGLAPDAMKVLFLLILFLNRLLFIGFDSHHAN